MARQSTDLMERENEYRALGTVVSPVIERLIGTIRCEFLDCLAFRNACDLRRKLLLFKEYYNCDRVHRGIDGTVPNPTPLKMDRKTARLHNHRWRSYRYGLPQLPIAV